MRGKPFPPRPGLQLGKLRHGCFRARLPPAAPRRLPGSCGICSRINWHVNEPLCIFIGASCQLESNRGENKPGNWLEREGGASHLSPTPRCWGVCLSVPGLGCPILHPEAWGDTRCSAVAFGVCPIWGFASNGCKGGSQWRIWHPCAWRGVAQRVPQQGLGGTSVP